MLAEVARITARLDIPVTADLEAGYGPTPEDVAETVRRAIEAGAVGANIEDGTKSDPATGGKPLFDLTLAVERIQAGREAADAMGVEFVINARTDGFIPIGKGTEFPEDANHSANAHHAAGASSPRMAARSYGTRGHYNV